eukprot:12228938-Alexandrium_andersonii.AAC.1
MCIRDSHDTHRHDAALRERAMTCCSTRARILAPGPVEAVIIRMLLHVRARILAPSPVETLIVLMPHYVFARILAARPVETPIV